MEKPSLQGSKKSKGLIRALDRKGVRDKKAAPAARKMPLKEPAICERCGAVLVRKTWRRDHHLSERSLAAANWTVCPACRQIDQAMGQGKVIIGGAYTSEESALIRRRIENIANRAAATQPQRRISTVEPAENGGMEVITTSQKLAHRIVHELKKIFGGRADYQWSDDGTLLARWEREAMSPRKRTRH